jgi:hypothetical protein
MRINKSIEDVSQQGPRARIQTQEPSVFCRSQDSLTVFAVLLKCREEIRK